MKHVFLIVGLCIAGAGVPGLAKASAGDDFRYRNGRCTDSGGRSGYNEGRLDQCGSRPNARLRFKDLTNRDLRGVQLEGARLWSSELNGTSLQGARMLLARMQRVDARASDLRGADLQWANLKRADFRGADFRGASLKGTELSHADFRGADFRGADLRVPPARQHGLKLEGARFNELTRLPVQWGDTFASRKNTAVSKGMVFEPVLETSRHVPAMTSAGCRDEENRRPESARSRAPGPVPGGTAFDGSDFSGSWSGQIADIDGTLVLNEADTGSFEGSFVSSDGSRRFAITGEQSREHGRGSRLVNRLLFRWVDGRGGGGRGWLLINREGDALTGSFGFGENANGYGKWTFIREDEPRTNH